MGATESKLAFRKNVLQLFEVRNISPENVEFWNAFIELPETAEDVFNLFSPKDLRKVRDSAPENLNTLLVAVSSRILKFASSVNRPDAVSIKSVLNCVRILTRVLPYIFEEETEFENDLFWTTAGTFQSQDSGATDVTLEPLGSNLIKAVVSLLFIKGFSLPVISSDTEGVHYIIWYKGVGASNAPSSSKDIDAIRSEVLRLLLTMMSRCIYVPPPSVLRYNNKWMNVLTTSLEKKAVLTLLCSLMNLTLSYDPVGWGLLPYNHVLFADTQEQLVTLSLHVLVALVDYASPTTSPSKRGSISDDPKSEKNSKENITSKGDPQSPLVAAESTDSIGFGKDNAVGSNSFRFFLSKLYRTQDFVVILDGICRLLKNPMDSANTYLPGSTKRVTIHVEVLMFFWKMIEVNEKFHHYALDSDKILTVLVSIIYFAFESRNDSSSVGLARMCCFMLHNLSQERAFGVQLNTVFDPSAHAIITKNLPIFTSGTYADFLFLAIHSFITTTSSRFSPLAALHESFLITLANVSPYVKGLTVVTANKLLGMWGVFVNGAWLCANETNHKAVFYLLETFNNLVQYQMTGNTPLIYAVVRNKEKFYDLHNLTFELAQKEINRLRTLKSQRAGVNAESVEEDEISEKKKGKLPAEVEGSPNAVFDAKGKFIPTEGWFNHWKSHLPLGVMLTLCDNLAPQVEQLCMEKGLNDDKKVLEYLQSGTLVGLLPIPHPLARHAEIRRQITNPSLEESLLRELSIDPATINNVQIPEMTQTSGGLPEQTPLALPVLPQQVVHDIQNSSILEGFSANEAAILQTITNLDAGIPETAATSPPAPNSNPETSSLSGRVSSLFRVPSYSSQKSSIRSLLPPYSSVNPSTNEESTVRSEKKKESDIDELKLTRGLVYMGLPNNSNAFGSAHVATAIDMAFLVDCTGSMSTLIRTVQQELTNIMDSLSTDLDFETANLAFVGYRDFSDGSKNYTIKQFTTNVPEMKTFISKVEAFGGDDAAEDVVGGYWNAVQNLSWTKRNHKLIVHFADYPGHGEDWSGRCGDKYKKSSSIPKSQCRPEKMDDYVKEMVEQGIYVIGVQLGPPENTQPTFDQIKSIFESYRAGHRFCTQAIGSNYSLIMNDVVNTMKSSLRSSGVKSRSSLKKA
ncbi:hypothetical protein HK098_005592 [Nowakowskiella sp. JEL0407]|nr:hypothetical protein HK098_005592 [Nowakowskiella sp. JEL0407]